MTLFVPLDVEYSYDDKIMEAGDPLAELVYVRALCFAKKNPQANGEFTRAQLVAFAHGIAAPAKRAEKLEKSCALVATERGWRIAGWLKRNKSGQEIAAAAEMASAMGIEGNHLRWHVGDDGKPSAKCPLCIGIHLSRVSGNPIAPRSATPNRGSSPEEEVEEEKEVKPEEEVEEEGIASKRRDDSDPEPVTPAAAALKMYVDHRMVTDTGIRNPTAYRATLTSNAREDHRAPLRSYLDRRPNATAEELAAHVFAIPGISVPQSEPRRDWYADPTCPTCEGDGMANTAPEGTPATYGPCDCRRTEPYMATIHELHPTGDVA